MTLSPHTTSLSPSTSKVSQSCPSRSLLSPLFVDACNSWVQVKNIVCVMTADTAGCGEKIHRCRVCTRLSSMMWRPWQLDSLFSAQVTAAATSCRRVSLCVACSH